MFFKVKSTFLFMIVYCFCPSGFTQNISPQELYKKLQEDSVFLLDVRGTDEFKTQHIDGALSFPLPIFEARQIKKLNTQNKEIVLYCRSGKRGEKAYQILQNENLNVPVHNLEGGIEKWQKEKFPIIEGSHVLPLNQQVHIIAGSLVLIGSIAGAFFSPVYLLLSGFIGGGLLFSGITGWCGLMKVLNFMPWNK